MLASKIGGYPWPSAKAHNNYLIALRGIFNMEYRGSSAILNPMIGNMALVRKLPDPLSRDDRDALLTDMREQFDERVLAYFQWMFFTGMPPEEAMAIRWSDPDLRRQLVRVQRVRTFRGSERDGSKTHTERDVELFRQLGEDASRPLCEVDTGRRSRQRPCTPGGRYDRRTRRNSSQIRPNGQFRGTLRNQKAQADQ
jgi:integrase